MDIKNTAALDKIIEKFIESTNNIVIFFEQLDNQVKLHDHYSMILMYVYNVFLMEYLKSCQCLAANKLFISFSKICRSMLDIIIQICWINNMDAPEREKAILCFIEFEGLNITKNGKVNYEWQKTIDPNYSARQISTSIGLDKELIELPIQNIPGYDKMNITVYDYFSKVVHFNPRILKELIGINKDKEVKFTYEYFFLSILCMSNFIRLMSMFTDIFVRNFYPDMSPDTVSIILKNNDDFMNFTFNELKTNEFKPVGT